MREAGVSSGVCFWQGRRAVEMTLEYVVIIVNDFTEEIGTALMQLRANGVLVHADLVNELERMATAIASDLDFRLGHIWHQFPGKIAVLFGEAIG